MKTKHSSQPQALETIDLACLHDVTGGRISNSGGTDPKVAQGMKSLAETVAQVGQAINQSKEKKKAELGQVMQQMMANKKA